MPKILVYTNTTLLVREYAHTFCPLSIFFLGPPLHGTKFLVVFFFLWFECGFV